MALEPNDLIAWQRLAQHRNLDEFRGLKPILAPELSRCFSQEVHEGQRLPYGVLIARDDDIGDLGRLVEIADQVQLARAADGVNALAYRTRESARRLLRLAEPLNSQDACSVVATRVDGVISRVDATGMIWVVSSDYVTTIDDRGGRTRPSTDKIVGELSQLVVTAAPPVLRAISGLAYSHFSPRKIGTTLLYMLTDADDHAWQSEGESIAALDLSILRSTDWPMIEHQLRHVDGAAVVDRNGRLLRRGVMLEASPDALNIRAEGGARHNSATLTIGPTFWRLSYPQTARSPFMRTVLDQLH